MAARKSSKPPEPIELGPDRPQQGRRARHAHGLTETEKAVVSKVVGGKSVKAAAADAGVSENAAYRLMKRDEARAYMLAVMNQAEMDDVYLVDRLKEVIESERTGLTSDGVVVNMGPDWQNRNKALELAFKLRDRFPNPKVDVEVQHSGAVVLRAEDLVGPDPFAEVVEGEFKALT